MKGKTYIVSSPAKINIGLHVKNKRKDGYHNIQTIFYPVGLYDELRIRISEIPDNGNINVKTNPNAGIDQKDNICLSAAEMFLKEFKILPNLKIDILIKKRIPIAAGLGGGSSNAAAVLKTLAKHFRVPNPKKLREIALRLGSDVPFFLLGKPAYAASKGEKLTPLPKFKIKYDILLVNPNIHVSTKWAYGKIDSKYQKAKSKNEEQTKLADIKKFDLKKVNVFKNDFEEVVFARYHLIGRIKKEMYKSGAVFSSMSGSGSTVYGFLEKGMNSAAKYFSAKGFRVYKIKRSNPRHESLRLLRRPD